MTEHGGASVAHFAFHRQLRLHIDAADVSACERDDDPRSEEYRGGDHNSTELQYYRRRQQYEPKQAHWDVVVNCDLPDELQSLQV